MPQSESAKSSIRILIVDDEPAICSILRGGLEAEGYAVSEAGSKAELVHCLETTPIDLITLDLNLGGEDGLQLAREVRAQRNMPIIMITAKAEPVDRVAGLEHGADDYIVKPFHIQEVLLRIRSVLRRYELEAESRNTGNAVDVAEELYKFEIGTLDVARRELTTTHGEPIDLTDIELDLLVNFLRRPARILSRDELMQLLKGRDWSPEDRTIDGYVARLRRKIDSQSEAPRLIKSVRGIGYVFAGEVERLDNS
jgi:two-component system OmpR family response regulator